MMQIALSPALLSRLPQIQVSGLIALEIDAAALPARYADAAGAGARSGRAAARLEAVVQGLARRQEGALFAGIPGQGGAKDKLRSILPLVDLYNQASLLSLSPFGGEDIAKLGGVLQLDLAAGDEPFLPLGRDQAETPQPGEAVWLNGERRVVCRCLNWLESDLFKLDAGVPRRGLRQRAAGPRFSLRRGRHGLAGRATAAACRTVAAFRTGRGAREL